jgi:hypothetical protein
MGVLDDAIREHLDLRRRHGVAEEELRRQEEEALGPARREVAPAETDEDGDGAAAEVEHAADAEADAAPAVEAAPEPEPELSESLPDDAPHSHEDQTVLDEPTEDHVPAGESVVDEAPPRAGDMPPQGFEELDDDELLDEEEPALEDEDLAQDDEPAEGDDPDLLEDTPDFLQETPEHDRLWFEQKPPRDFDFD